VPAAQCEWLFYVIADEQGNHAFSVTAEQWEADRQAAQDAGLL
jgi:cell division protein YceG involved in septum cleavage